MSFMDFMSCVFGVIIVLIMLFLAIGCLGIVFQWMKFVWIHQIT